MLNREIYSKDPSENILVNNGVVNVSDDQSDESLKTLRFELETFVCDGQYEVGLEKILKVFNKNISSPEQPGVWISGFFGSGKSHLAKMLRALWIDYIFPHDKASSRSLANLPTSVKDQFKELSTEGKRYGGLHAASGTLGAGAGDNVRMALLGIIFKSVGLPEQYHVARFEMRLKEQGIVDAVRKHVESGGKKWEKERDHVFNSPLIIEGLLKAWPDFADSAKEARDLLRSQYSKVQDVTNDEMVNAIKDALSVNSKFPLTVIILDEVQQFIGTSAERAYKVQEVTEACTKKFKGKLLFVGTGQTALTGTSLLQKLMGRFKIPVELSDNDVETVIRKIILAKKPSHIPEIEKTMMASLGEISRHLTGTKIEHRNDDTKVFAQDYPILPVRRRLWEKILRIVDPTGTVSQLRNQLSIVHEATINTLDKPLGTVVPGDFIYSQIISSLLQTAAISKELYENIQLLSNGSEDEKLMGRLCGLIFLIGKLPRETVVDIGVKAKAEMLADLLVEDITAGSAELRKKIPGLLKKLEDDGLIMAFDDEYRIQTPESSAWHDEYRKQVSELTGNPTRIDDERVTLLRKAFNDSIKNIRLNQGACKEPRSLTMNYSHELPPDASKKIYVWVRDGWETDEKSVLADARNAGNQSPTIFVYIPRHAADELGKLIISMLSAQATLDIRGTTSTKEGEDAKNAMAVRLNDAQSHLKALIKEIFSNIRVFQAGGNDIVESELADAVQKAANNSLVRLYKEFDVADHPQWNKVYEQAKKGSGDALKAVGHSEDPAKHPVCSAILKYIAGGKKGSDIRDHFRETPYGWPQDAIDGALFGLLVSGLIRAHDIAGKPVDVKALERAKVGQTQFKVESITITTPQLIKVRKVLQTAGIQCKPGEESSLIPVFVQTMLQKADVAGGDPPNPKRPDVDHLLELKSLTGNEQILAVFNQGDTLIQQIKEWDDQSALIKERITDWLVLEELLQYASDLGPAAKLKEQAQAIENNRMLLNDPNPMEGLIEQAIQLLRKALAHAHDEFGKVYDQKMSQLLEDANWQKIEETQRNSILKNNGIVAVPVIAMGNVEEITESLDVISLESWRLRREALPHLFEQARIEAAKLLEPKVTPVNLPHRTLRTEDDARAWVKDIEILLIEKIKKGPVMV